MELLAELKAFDADLPVVVMTAWGSIQVAVEAMRHGAGDIHREAVGTTRA
jgi:FixJ family two-component response regulator